ncbi:UNVERIFIED_ORG: hypothetical protein FHR35_007722 [Microbispora rosea subsp. rosea]
MRPHERHKEPAAPAKQRRAEAPPPCSEGGHSLRSRRHADSPSHPTAKRRRVPPGRARPTTRVATSHGVHQTNGRHLCRPRRQHAPCPPRRRTSLPSPASASRIPRRLRLRPEPSRESGSGPLRRIHDGDGDRDRLPSRTRDALALGLVGEIFADGRRMILRHTPPAPADHRLSGSRRLLQRRFSGGSAQEDRHGRGVIPACPPGALSASSATARSVSSGTHPGSRTGFDGARPPIGFIQRL